MSSEWKPVTRYDEVEVKQFEACLKSASFRMYLERVEAERRRAELTCTQADEELALRRAQGAVEALHMALHLPAQLLLEMKSRKR